MSIPHLIMQSIKDVNVALVFLLMSMYFHTLPKPRQIGTLPKFDMLLEQFFSFFLPCPLGEICFEKLIPTVSLRDRKRLCICNPESVKRLSL